MADDRPLLSRLPLRDTGRMILPSHFGRPQKIAPPPEPRPRYMLPLFYLPHQFGTGRQGPCLRCGRNRSCADCKRTAPFFS